MKCEFCKIEVTKQILKAHQDTCSKNPARREVFKKVLYNCYDYLEKKGFTGSYQIITETNLLEVGVDIKCYYYSGYKIDISNINILAKNSSEIINLKKYFNSLEKELQFMITENTFEK